MKRYLTLLLVFALVAMLFAGCGGRDNVSDDAEGIITEDTDSAAQDNNTTTNTTRSTTPTASTNDTNDNNNTNGNDNGTGNNTDDTNGIGSADGTENSSEETDTNSRSRRAMPRF